MSLNYENYRGEIVYGSERFAFMPATPGDVEQIAEMYGDISINDCNYKVKLDPNHEESFARTGGMFEIHTRESIEKEIRGKNTCFGVMKNFGGKIVSCLWFGLANPLFVGIQSESYPGCDLSDYSVVKALRDGTVSYPLELICIPGKLHNAAHVMFYTVLKTYWQNGYTHSLFEVYALRGYRYNGQRKRIDMLNQRSFDMCCGIGGVFFGNLPDFDVRLGQLSVTISPKAFYYDHAAQLPALRQRLNEAGVVITFDRGDEA